jgi:hypothetical protein
MSDEPIMRCNFAGHSILFPGCDLKWRKHCFTSWWRGQKGEPRYDSALSIDLDCFSVAVCGLSRSLFSNSGSRLLRLFWICRTFWLISLFALSGTKAKTERAHTTEISNCQVHWIELLRLLHALLNWYSKGNSLSKTVPSQHWRTHKTRTKIVNELVGEVSRFLVEINSMQLEILER